jgi:hypothetical protein
MRQFQPIEPYKDGHTVGIDEHGNSHQVWPDGRTELYGHIETRTNIWRPMFTLEELENLVRGGKWQEVTPAQEHEEAPPELQHAADADNGPDIQDRR